MQKKILRPAQIEWLYYLIIEKYTKRDAKKFLQNEQNDGSGNKGTFFGELDSPPLTEKDLGYLYFLVDFPDLNVERLRIAVSNELIPHDLIPSVLREKLQ